MSRKKKSLCLISTSEKPLVRSLSKVSKACCSCKKVDSGTEHEGLQTRPESVIGLNVFTVGVSVRRSDTSGLPDSQQRLVSTATSEEREEELAGMCFCVYYNTSDLRSALGCCAKQEHRLVDTNTHAHGSLCFVSSSNLRVSPAWHHCVSATITSHRGFASLCDVTPA